MRRYQRFVLTFSCVLSLCCIAQANTTIYSTGFEPPTYTVGTIFGQDSWGTSGGNAADLIQTGNVKSGTQAFEVNTALTTGGLTGGIRSVAFDSTSATDKFLHVSDDAYLSSTGSASFWSVLQSLVTNDLATGFNVDNNRHLILVGTTSVDSGMVVTLDTWHHYDMWIDFAHHQFVGYYDGVLVIPPGGSAFQPIPTTVVSLEAVSFYNQGNGTDQGFVDNYVVQSVTVAPPIVVKSFGAATVPLNGTQSLTFNIFNPNPTTLDNVSFNDTFPAGLTVSLTTPNNCGPLATGGSTSTHLVLANMSFAGGTTCTLGGVVTGVTAGVQNNTTDPVSATESGAGEASNTATITVVAPPSATKSFNPSTVPLGG